VCDKHFGTATLPRIRGLNWLAGGKFHPGIRAYLNNLTHKMVLPSKTLGTRIGEGSPYVEPCLFSLGLRTQTDFQVSFHFSRVHAAEDIPFSMV